MQLPMSSVVVYCNDRIQIACRCPTLSAMHEFGQVATKLVVMGARNDAMAQVVSTLALAGVEHMSATVKLEHTVGSAQDAWGLVERAYLRDAYAVVLANGPFWIHSGLAGEAINWVSKGAHSLVVSVPHGIDPRPTAELFNTLAETRKVARRVTVFEAPQTVRDPVRVSAGPVSALRSNGWKQLHDRRQG